MKIFFICFLIFVFYLGAWGFDVNAENDVLPFGAFALVYLISFFACLFNTLSEG
jgi:quinol-cytochrome oxidoreductase complex cytochrome b subunit